MCVCVCVVWCGVVWCDVWCVCVVCVCVCVCIIIAHVYISFVRFLSTGLPKIGRSLLISNYLTGTYLHNRHKPQVFIIV